MSKSRNLYPCRAEQYETQEAATLALETRRHYGLRNRLIEVEQPYTYRCTEGHWHYSLVQRAI